MKLTHTCFIICVLVSTLQTAYVHNGRNIVKHVYSRRQEPLVLRASTGDMYSSFGRNEHNLAPIRRERPAYRPVSFRSSPFGTLGRVPRSFVRAARLQPLHDLFGTYGRRSMPRRWAVAEAIEAPVVENDRKEEHPVLEDQLNSLDSGNKRVEVVPQESIEVDMTAHVPETTTTTTTTTAPPPPPPDTTTTSSPAVIPVEPETTTTIVPPEPELDSFIEPRRIGGQESLAPYMYPMHTIETEFIAQPNRDEHIYDRMPYELHQPTMPYIASHPVDDFNDYNRFDYSGFSHFSQPDMGSGEPIASPIEPTPRYHINQPRRSYEPWARRDIASYGQPRHIQCLEKVGRGMGLEETSSWYYNVDDGRCHWFGYHGNRGNANRFASRAACEGYCINDVEDLCQVANCPGTGGKPCMLYEDDDCVSFALVMGEPSEKLCPPKQPVCFSRWGSRMAPVASSDNVPPDCKQPVDAGQCNKKVPSVKFYYDPANQDCKTFYFNDCGGNDNRFETKSECMTHCSP